MRQQSGCDHIVEQPSVPLPAKPVLDPGDPKTQLQVRLRSVLLGLPAYFEFNNHVSGINATDLYSLNSLLGASIEGQVVKALNRQRRLWDPDDEWLGFTFERQAQAFPDVRLTRRDPSTSGADTALGIELKGWFLLAKEGEPSFRFTTTAAACAEHDLLVVVPWYLDNVLSGSPVAAEPLVVSARWAAEYRNYYWMHLRRAAEGVDRTITVPLEARPYPAKSDIISDDAVYDRGGNFGRIARAEGLMTDWVRATNETEVLGVCIKDWYLFLKAHSDQADRHEVSSRLERQLQQSLGQASSRRAERIVDAVEAMVREYCEGQ